MSFLHLASLKKCETCPNEIPEGRTDKKRFCGSCLAKRKGQRGYAKNRKPKFCVRCNQSIPYQPGVFPKKICADCARLIVQKYVFRTCVYCDKILGNRIGIFCSHRCASNFNSILHPRRSK